MLLCKAPVLLSAQGMSSITMPEISGPSMPSMPTISAGSISTSSGSAASSSGSGTGGSASGSSGTTGTGLTAASLLGLSSTTGLGTLSSLLGSDTDASLLTSLLGSSSGSDDLSLLSALSGTTLGGTNTTTTVLLTQIIDRLDKLTKQLEAQGNPAGSTTEAAATNADSTVTAKSASAGAPGLIRFRIAGYDILSSFTDLYISTPEKNGSFLLTADRTYTADYRQRTETIYMLFTADSTAAETGAGFLNSYTVTISLLQDYQNPNSFMYRLSQATPLQAEKTGNLVSLRLDGALKADILLQLE